MLTGSQGTKTPASARAEIPLSTTVQPASAAARQVPAAASANVAGQRLEAEIADGSTAEPVMHMLARRGVQLIRPRFQSMKRIFDVAACLAVLPLALPIIAVCAVLVWIDNPGPIFFRQARTGWAGRRFKMFKFRTMVTNAEELKQKYAHLNELTWPDFKITDDPRVTRVGRLLRKTSLDELPQIFNVLRGDMSLVGPRPTSFDASTYALWHTERLEVLPGITGLWQVSGRSDLDFDDRLRLDIEYIEQRSMWLDLRIILRTVTAIFSQRGAY